MRYRQLNAECVNRQWHFLHCRWHPVHHYSLPDILRGRFPVPRCDFAIQSFPFQVSQHGLEDAQLRFVRKNKARQA